MKQITDKTIDQIIDQLDAAQDGQFEKLLDQASTEQPMLFAYLSSENFELLTEDEHGYLMYIALITYLAYKKTNPQLMQVSEDQIGEAEERNYEMLENSPGQTFSDQLDPFFEGYPQQDLLALAEEAILDDEDGDETVVTDEGAPHIFIALKSIIDAMIAATPATHN